MLEVWFTAERHGPGAKRRLLDPGLQPRPGSGTATRSIPSRKLLQGAEFHDLRQACTITMAR